MKTESQFLTLMILASSTTEPKTFKVKKSWLKAGLVMTILLTIVTAFIFTSHYFLLEERNDLQSFKRMYIDQKQELAELTSIVTEMSGEMNKLETYAGKLRAVTGLQSEDILRTSAEVGGGVGGEGELLALNKKSNPEIVNLQKDLLVLQNNIALQQHDFKDIIEKVVKKKNLLESTPSIWPINGWLSSKYGKRISPFTGRTAMHKGIDIANKKGTPIIAPANGTVIKAGKYRYLGNMVKMSHGNGIKTLYAHMSKILVKKGDKLKRGDVMGLVGSTGRSTAPHLHYSVYKNNKTVNPLKYIIEE